MSKSIKLVGTMHSRFNYKQHILTVNFEKFRSLSSATGQAAGFREILIQKSSHTYVITFAEYLDHCRPIYLSGWGLLQSIARTFSCFRLNWNVTSSELLDQGEHHSHNTWRKYDLDLPSISWAVKAHPPQGLLTSLTAGSARRKTAFWTGADLAIS